MSTAPNTSNYSLGRGILYFDRQDSDGLPTGMRDLGNALNFSITTAVETLKHYSNRQTLKKVDREEPISAEAGGKFTLDEYARDNIALHVFGEFTSDEVRILTQSSVKGHLRFVGAADNDPRFQVDLWLCSIKPAGESTFLTDATEWGKLEFEFVIEDDTANHPDTPYGKIIHYVES